MIHLFTHFKLKLFHYYNCSIISIFLIFLEEEQRWGKQGRNIGSIDMKKLIEETEKSDADQKRKLFEDGPNASHGYGGKFGVEKDRMDKSAVGHDYLEKVEKHTSQKGKSSLV